MGKVYRVRNLISEREEAMKVVLPDVAAEPEVLDRFLREIKLQASLVHPNIAGLHTAVRAGGGLLMIMELIEGQSLSQILRSRGKLPVAEAVSYIDQVLSALAFAHGRGVIHRDVKPANILIAPDGTAKLTDFGIARAVGDNSITGTGRALGSLYYMSPEQVRAQPADGRSDLYSLGVTLYEAVTGRRPIQGATEYELMSGHLNEMPAPPHAVAPEVPEPLSAVILKALQKDPALRFASAAEFQQALRSHGTAPAARTALHRAPVAASIAATATILADPVMAKLESRLARRVGPIARSLVRDAVRRHSTLPEICRELSDHLPEAERAAFLRSCADLPDATPVPGSGSGAAFPPAGTRTMAGTFDPSLLETARRSLAAYVGPIAKMMVDRAARKSATAQQLYEALAQQIGDEKDRKSFLATAPK